VVATIAATTDNFEDGAAMPAERSRPDVAIRGMWPQDWPAVERIYALGLDRGTLETAVPDRQSFLAARPEALRLVAVDPAGTVLGWAAATPVSARPVYAGVVEHSVYVDPDAHGRGVGRALLEAFVRGSELAGVWSIRSGLFPENTASRALHARCGFREVGRYDRPGRRDGVWRDVLVIERRSAVVGLDGEPLIRLARPGDPGPPAWRRWVAEAAGGGLVGRAALDRAGSAGSPAYRLTGPEPRQGDLAGRLLATVLAAAELDAPGPAPVLLPASAGDAAAARLGFAPAAAGQLRAAGFGDAGYLRTVGS
jgi:phosphinothricin acetyltransferase